MNSFEHPAITGKHVVSMRRDVVDGHVCHVGKCQCGWSVNTRLNDRDGYAKRETAIEAHWKAEIAEHDRKAVAV